MFTTFHPERTPWTSPMAHRRTAPRTPTAPTTGLKPTVQAKHSQGNSGRPPSPGWARRRRRGRSGFAVAGGEEHGWDFLLRGVAVANDDVDEGRDAGCYRYREDHGEAAEEDADGGDGDEDDEWSQADRVAEDAWYDEVVLEQAYAEDDGRGKDRDLWGDGEADSDGHPSCRERSDYGDDFDKAGEGAKKNEVGLADGPES